MQATSRANSKIPRVTQSSHLDVTGFSLARNEILHDFEIGNIVQDIETLETYKIKKLYRCSALVLCFDRVNLTVVSYDKLKLIKNELDEIIMKREQGETRAKLDRWN